MNKVKKKFVKLSFLNKVRISYTLLVMLPVLILEVFVFFSSTNFIREQQRLQASETIERNHLNIENQMKMCEKSVLYVACNSTLKDFLVLGDKDYIKRNQTISNVNNLIYNAWLSNSYFSKMQVYSEKKIPNNNAVFKDISEESDRTWYDASLDTTATLWWYKDGRYYITRRIAAELPEKVYGVLRAEVKEKLFSDSISMFSEMPAEIIIKNGEELLLDCCNEKAVIDDQKDYEEIRDLKETGWKIIYRIDRSYFSSAFHPRIILSVVIVGLLLAAGFVAVNKSTQSLLRYLYQVIDDVKKVKDGNFSIQIKESSQDEIGELAKSINKMLQKIQTLIDEVYKSKLDKKSLELNLLQSKINPHFLYNNLSAINWIAIENGEDRIYEITTQLATFYRTALNKGINVDRLSVEVENIKAYVNLQLIAHEDGFDVEYNIEEGLMNEMIPIFIMQPLVENSIEHGIDRLREERGKICIEISANKEEIVIWIRDNGKELYRKIGQGKMPREEFGYGVSNVDKRICLLCGEKYGVDIFADKTGTTSQIRLRRDLITLEKKG